MARIKFKQFEIYVLSKLMHKHNTSKMFRHIKNLNKTNHIKYKIYINMQYYGQTMALHVEKLY